MSRVFDGNIANYLSLSSVSHACAQDHSFACYIKLDVHGGVPISLADSSSSQDPRFYINSTTTPEARFVAQPGTGFLSTTTGTPSLDTWHLMVGVFDESTVEVTIYLDSNTGSTVQDGSTRTGTMDRLTVGVLGDSTISSPVDGKIAQVMYWEGYELTTTDVQALVDATSTAELNAVANANLTYHYPLDGSNLSDEQATGADLSVTGTVASSTDDPFSTGSGSTYSLIAKQYYSHLLGSTE